MENNVIQTFVHEKFGKVRVVIIDGVIWFVGKDVALALGYVNTRDALAKHVDAEDKKYGVAIRDSIGREQKVTVINESGLYSLIFNSRLEDAKKFKHWVTSMVLPKLRQNGTYTMPDAAFTEDLSLDKKIDALIACARLTNLDRLRNQIIRKVIFMTTGEKL